MKQTKVWLVISVAMCVLALSLACSKGPEPNKAEETASGAGPYNGPKGTVTGTVAFNGTPPAPKKIDTAADPVCGQKNPTLSTEDTVVKDGKLANVFVYVKDGTTADGKKVGDFTWATPSTAVTLDQNGCHYNPHVFVVQVNQKLTIT